MKRFALRRTAFAAAILTIVRGVFAPALAQAQAGPAAQPVIASNRQSAMSALAVNGYSQATTNGLPTSFGITNTASYIRTGATAAEQPYFIFQGT